MNFLKHSLKIDRRSNGRTSPTQGNEIQHYCHTCGETKRFKYWGSRTFAGGARQEIYHCRGCGGVRNFMVA